jgi:Holliday junction resolvasome RuvABC DNA-binding subunit
MQSARPKPPSEREPLAGLVERVTFHNADNGFCVLRVKARGHRDLVTVLGAAPSISAGEYIQASGSWENNREHGLQFRAAFLRATAPTSAEGMEKYLGSGLIRGIGPAFAQRLVSAFNEAVFEVIEHAPQRLLEVEGIGPKRARRITSSWADQKVIREIMSFLQSHGVGTSRAVRIFKTYGADAIPLVTENPYRLARDITGIGFKSADLIAGRLGIARTAMVRAKAGIAYTLAEAMSNGHCGLAEDELLIQAPSISKPLLRTIATAICRFKQVIRWPIEPLVIWSTDKRLQVTAESDRVRRADVSVKRLEILEALDQLKMIGCPCLGNQGEGFDAGILEAVRDELLEQLYGCGRRFAIHRVYVDMGDDDDRSEAGGMNRRASQRPGNHQ